MNDKINRRCAGSLFPSRFLFGYLARKCRQAGENVKVDHLENLGWDPFLHNPSGSHLRDEIGFPRLVYLLDALMLLFSSFPRDGDRVLLDSDAFN
ncbi:hypothetical protein ATO6_14440 [Oceanicola sp. 22II-s10i]|nr:hypothetical protein ATO6_14440 [Oceanicola sp. 22II-s10i]